MPPWPSTTFSTTRRSAGDLRRVDGRARWSRRAGLLPLAFVTFVSLGLPDGTLGVAWPSMRDSFDRPVSSLGVLVVVFTAGYLLSTVVAGRLSDWFGTGLLLATATGSA